MPLRIDDASPYLDRTQLPFPSGWQSTAGRGLTIAASPDGMRVYMGANAGVWRSDDGGINWVQMTRPQPPRHTTTVPGALLVNNVYDVAVSATDPDIVMVAANYDVRVQSQSGIYRSVDGGNSWALVQPFLSATGFDAVGQISAAPDEPELFYAACGAQLLQSNDSGTSWSNIPLPMDWSDSVWNVAAGPAEPSGRRIYALGSQLWVSVDGGATWAVDLNCPSEIESGAPDNAVGDSARMLAIDPLNPAILYATGMNGAVGVVWSRDDSGPMPVWQQYNNLPSGYPGTTESGTNYVCAHAAPSGNVYIFASDRASTQVTLAGDLGGWQRLDSTIHVDPHAIAVSPDFQLASDGGGQGRIWLVNDGGVYLSTDGAANWTRARGISTLSLINAAVMPTPGTEPAICFGTGDNGGFYSPDGGFDYVSGDYQQGDNDACFSDPVQPSMLFVFAPRSGNHGAVVVYTAPANAAADGGTGTSQGHTTPGPVSNHRWAWNCISSNTEVGYRPLVLTLSGQAPRPGGDFITIYGATDGAWLVRSTAMASITDPDDWNSTATDEGSGAHVFRQGPMLPDPSMNVVQASGGHDAPVFYVGNLSGLWKWTSGMSAWQSIVPSTQTGPQAALRYYVDPYRPERLFVLDGSNMWRSGDGGQFWWEETALEAALSENGVYPFTIPANATPNDALLQDMQFDPDDPNTMYAAGPAGTFYSVDGVHWDTLVNCTALCARPMGLFYDRISHPVTRSLYMAFAYRGLLKLSQLPVPLLQVNVTAITQQKCTDQLASWRTPNGPYMVDHIGGIGPEHDVKVFWWSPLHDWQAVNVSRIAGRQLRRGLTSWQVVRFGFKEEHLAGVDHSRHMVDFWWSPAHDWQARDLTDLTGETLQTGLTSWIIESAGEPVEHLAAANDSSQLIVFYRSTSYDWKTVNVTQKTGAQVVGTPANWQTTGAYIYEHLAARDPQGNLLVFWWSPAQDWQVVNLSEKTGYKIASESPTSWLTPNGPELVHHVAARSPHGDLLVFYWAPSHDWEVVNVSGLTGQKIAGTPVSWQTDWGRPYNVEFLAAVDNKSQLQIFFWTPETNWRVTNATELSRIYLQQGLTVYQTPNGPYNVEHIAGATKNDTLVVLYSRGSEMLLP